MRLFYASLHSLLAIFERCNLLNDPFFLYRPPLEIVPSIFQEFLTGFSQDKSFSFSLFFFFFFLNEMKFSTNEDKNAAINDDGNRSFSRI